MFHEPEEDETWCYVAVSAHGCPDEPLLQIRIPFIPRFVIAAE